MKKIFKPVDEIQISDWEQYPVWEFATDMEEELPDETWMRPLKKLPVENLENRLIGVLVELNNGSKRWAMLGNLSLNDPEQTEQFLCLAIYLDQGVFHLACYFDSDYERRSPRILAEALGLTLEETFPIKYDISKYVVGDERVIKGEIHAEPKRKLSDDERMALIFRR